MQKTVSWLHGLQCSSKQFLCLQPTIPVSGILGSLMKLALINSAYSRVSFLSKQENIHVIDIFQQTTLFLSVNRTSHKKFKSVLCHSFLLIFHLAHWFTTPNILCRLLRLASDTRMSTSIIHGREGQNCRVLLFYLVLSYYHLQV